MGGFTYGGKFEKHINELYSPKNIHKTAKKFAEYEKKHGPYKFGQSYTKVLVPKTETLEGRKGIDQGTQQLGEELRRISLRRSATSLPRSSGPTCGPRNRNRWS